MKKFDNFNIDDLWKLRMEVVVNSLFIHDYENSFGLNSHDVCDFFDGYVSFINELAKEDGYGDLSIRELCNIYDNKDILLNWYNCFDDFSWMRYEV